MLVCPRTSTNYKIGEFRKSYAIGLAKIQEQAVLKGWNLDPSPLSDKVIEDISPNEKYVTKIIVNPFEEFEVPYFVNDGTVENFVYDTTVNDTCATFDVTFYQDAIGLLSSEKLGVLDNDSIGFEQEFSNY